MTFDDEDSSEEFFENATAKDFYFAVVNTDDGDCVVIVPKEYFDAEELILDVEMPIDHLLPSYMYNAMEGIWETTAGLKTTRDELLKRGFIENQELADLIDG